MWLTHPSDGPAKEEFGHADMEKMPPSERLLEPHLVSKGTGGEASIGPRIGAAARVPRESNLPAQNGVVRPTGTA